jgi:adenylate cyclase
LSVELAFRDAAKDSESVTELEAYLGRYPEGGFVSLAQARLAALRQTETDGEQPREDESPELELSFWDSVKDSGNPDMFRAYLHRYPVGTFTELAQINIDKLRG